MTSIRKIDNIVVTYYVNPHHFYFKYENDEKSDAVLNRITTAIEKYVNEKIETQRLYAYSPKIGEIALCHYMSDCVDKWIRVRVDNIAAFGKEKFTLWAIDYGFALESEPRWIRKLLSDELKVVEKGLIFKAGLFEIIPASVKWNPMDSAEETYKTKRWSAKAVEVVEKYFDKPDSVTFKCSAFLKDHYFGSVTVHKGGTSIVIEDFLRDMKEAMDCINFVKEYTDLDRSPYWERQQQDAIFKIYKNNKGEQPVTDDLLNNANNKQCPQQETTKDDEDNGLEEGPINLVFKNPFSRRQKPTPSTSLQSTSGCVAKSSSTQIDTKEILSKIPINNVPMNKRLTVAQEKLVEKGKLAAMKQARIDEVNKKLMDMKFPAGYIVDTNAMNEKIAERDGKNGGSSSESKKTNFNFQKAQELEECFTSNQKHRILVHNHNNILKAPINDISEAHFSQEIHAALKYLNYTQIYRVQCFGWPIIMRGSSLIVVNREKSGKTWTYLPAICSLIIEQFEDGQVINGSGPLSIITCTSSREVEKIAKDCQDLLRGTPQVRCVKAYGFQDDAVVNQLLNGFEILITTIPRLRRLMAHPLQLFNKERIISLVFDNIDLVYDQFSREVFDIYKSLCDPVQNKTVQTIVTSRTWHKILETFYKESSDMTLCIAAYIEAAVYARTEITLKLFKEEFKFDSLISYLNEEKYRSELTLVICNEPEDVQALLLKLRSMSIKIWHCHDKSDSSDISEIKNMINITKSGHLRPLICTDDTLPDLDIRSAQHIIHFSLPSTWTKFTFRFSALMEYHENFLLKKKHDKPVATSMVFLDEKNNEQLPRLIEFMELRGNTNIPAEVKKIAETQRILNEEHRSNVYKPFCKDLLTIGACHGRLTCQDRHVLTKFDQSRHGIPRHGIIKFEIIAIRTPAHFTVRLLEHRASSHQQWSKLQSTDNFLSFSTELTKYFKNVDNQVIHYPYNLGDLCVVRVDSEIGTSYQRGKIVKIEKKKLMNVLDTVVTEILLVDSNDIFSCDSNDLMYLPEEFQNYPHQAVDVRIAGIRPRDFDSEWDKQSLLDVKHWTQTENDHYFQGCINLSIMDTLWVESIELIEILHSLQHEVKSVSIKRKLIEHNFGEKDSMAMELLLTLATKADFNERGDGFLPNPIVDNRESTDLLFHSISCSASMIDVDDSDISRLNWTTSSDEDDVYQSANESSELNASLKSVESVDILRESRDRWAQLMMDKFNQIELGTFYHPDRVYIRNFDPTSKSRMSDLNKRIDEFSLSGNLKVLSNIALAENCLAKIKEKLHRGKIIKIDDGSDTVEVLFVDIGEILYVPKNELFEIPKTFVTTLPFQAIFCKLIGIRPPNNDPGWSETICDDIYDNILNTFPFFYARPMNFGKPDKYIYGLNCHSYDVVLFDRTGDFNINNMIVSSGYGDFHPDTQHFIDVAVEKNALKPSKDDSSDDSDYVECNDAMVDDFEDERPWEIEFDDEDIKKWFEDSQCPVSFEDVKQAILEMDEDNKETPSPVIVEEIHDEASASVVNNNVRQEFEGAEEGKQPSLSRSKELTQLDSMYKLPKIQWHQSDDKIVLTIHAPDVTEYYLKVTPRLVHLCYEKGKDKFAAILNLFGCVDAEFTSHEIRSLNIVIRLTKTFSRLPWPRLVQNKQKCHWIQYNLDAKLEADEICTDSTFNIRPHIIENPTDESDADESDGEGDFDE